MTRAPMEEGFRPLLVALEDAGQPASSATVDAVVVPAARDARNLEHAARVAQLCGATLLVLASRATDPSAAAAVACRRLDRRRVVVVGFRAEAGDARTRPDRDLSADRLALPIERRDADTAAKRNLALAVARMVGWRHLLFLDDDVRAFGETQLSAVAAAFHRRPTGPLAIGWAFDDFPDHSVVCHANRDTGGRQTTFIGAGALAVRITPSTPHFPHLYNEDWLFLYSLLAQRRVLFAGTLSQVAYDPYDDPERARRQEFGDVLAEGVFRHLMTGGARRELNEKWWAQEAAGRSRFLRDVRRRLEQHEYHDDWARHARKAVEAAASAATAEWPAALAQWVARWRKDSVVWRRRMELLPQIGDVGDALAYLGAQPLPLGPKRPRLPAFSALTRPVRPPLVGV